MLHLLNLAWMSRFNGGIEVMVATMDWITQHNHSLTLRELLEGGNELIYQCSECGRKTPLDLRELIQRHGAETRVAYITRNTQCPNCA